MREGESRAGGGGARAQAHRLETQLLCDRKAIDAEAEALKRERARAVMLKAQVVGLVKMLRRAEELLRNEVQDRASMLAAVRRSLLRDVSAQAQGSHGTRPTSAAAPPSALPRPHSPPPGAPHSPPEGAGVDGVAAAFALLDRNGDGALSRAEVIRGLRTQPSVRALLGFGATVRQEDGTREAFEVVYQVTGV
jgi:hypothetical protein